MILASRLVAFGLLLLAATATAGAVSVDRWSVSHERDFLLGTFEGTGLDAEGRIALAPQLTHLWGPEAGIVWDLAAGPKDSVFVALSGPGQVVSIDAEGAGTVWYQADGESLITALLADGRGGVYAGLSPEGRVLHLKSPGEIAVMTETDATFIWALEADGPDTLWIGTGFPGRVYRLHRSRGLETVYETGDDPVRSLAATGSGGVIAGTGGRGRVLRLSPDGSPFVLFDADETEIVALSHESDGTIWALAAAGGKQPSKPGAKEAQGAATHVRVTAKAPEPENKKNSQKQPQKPTKNGQAQTFRANAGGALYRLDESGVERVWKTATGIPFDVIVDADGFLLVATGDKGQVWQIDRNGRKARTIPIASNQASALARNEKGRIWIAGTSDARVERLDPQPRSKGDYVSLPADARVQARWGRVSWTADTPEGTKIEVAVRAGNTTAPDETWSDWISLPGDGQIEPGRLPPSRLLQIKLSLSSSANGSPTVSELGLSFEPRNRAPEIASISVEPPGVVIVPGPTQSAARLGPLVADDPVTRAVTNATPKGRPRVPIRRGWEAGARTFSWIATDPDADRLAFRLDIRHEEDLYWYPLAARLKGSYFSWDARATPDGRYRVRLTATDGTDNAEGEALTDSQISEMFRIDNSRPVVEDWTIERRGATRRVAFTAVDPGGIVAAVEVAMDAGAWQPLYPEDGVADSEIERYRLTLPEDGETDLPESVRVRITDAAGNLGGEMKRVERPGEQR